VICCRVTRQQTPPACRYVKGDFRFRKGYSKSNPRKMVKLWAEKEMRNLIRLSEAGIRCPTAHQLQMHVLVMGFIGSGDVAAPRLKDADLPLVRRPAACRLVAAPARASKLLLGLAVP
jgi:serine/threonine-protein kinase RIO1